MILLVGNSIKIIGKNLGKIIDKFDFVIRFNKFSIDDKFSLEKEYPETRNVKKIQVNNFFMIRN